MKIILDIDKKTITVPWNYSDKLAAMNKIIESVLKTLSNEIGVAIKGINEYSATEIAYSGEYEMNNNLGYVGVKDIEYRKRCNICGHIFCYNEADIKKNKSNAKSAFWSSIASMGQAFGGAYTASAVNNSNTKANSLVIFYLLVKILLVPR